MKFAMVLLVALIVGCGSDWQRAERDAKEYASKLPGATGEVSCTKLDSDNDGYCACSVFMKDGKIVPIECGCERRCIWCTEGCKQINTLKYKGRHPR